MKRTNRHPLKRINRGASLPQFDSIFWRIASTECGDPTKLLLRQARRHHGTSRSGEFIRSSYFASHYRL
jgi:hypothetical protein